MGWYAAFGLMPFGSSIPALLILLVDRVRGAVNRSQELFPRLSAPLARWAIRLLLALLFSTMLSSAFSPRPLVAFVSDLGFLLVLCGIFHGAIDLGRLGPEPLRRRYLPLMVCAGAAACLAALARFGVMQYIVHDLAYRAANLFTGCNGLGTTLIFVGGPGITWLIQRGGKWPYLIPPFLGLVCLTLLATGSRGAWIGFAGMLAAICLFNRRLLLPLLVAVLVLGLAYTASPFLRERFRCTASFDLRLDIWRSSWRLIRANPLVGVGTGVYPHAIEEYAVGSTRDQKEVPFAHNIFLQAWAEFGVLGLIAFSSFLLVILRMSLALARGGDLVYQGIFAAFVGIILHQQVDCTILGLDLGGAFWMLIGLVIGLYTHERDRKTRNGITGLTGLTGFTV